MTYLYQIDACSWLQSPNKLWAVLDKFLIKLRQNSNFCTARRPRRRMFGNFLTKLRRMKPCQRTQGGALPGKIMSGCPNQQQIGSWRLTTKRPLRPGEFPSEYRIEFHLMDFQIKSYHLFRFRRNEMADSEHRISVARYLLDKADAWFEEQAIFTDEKLWSIDEHLNRRKFSVNGWL